MSRPRDRSLYFASDKDLFDLMTSARQRLSTETLLELIRDRGIFLSGEDPRDHVVDYISLLPHDYHDLHLLLAQTESMSRKEKMTSSTIDYAVSVEDLRKVVSEIERERGERCAEVYSPSVASPARFELEVGYTEVDYSKTRLRQKRGREAKIEFELRTNGVTIRRPANAKSSELVDALLTKLRQIKDENLVARKIDLSSLTSAEARTKFFTEMIRQIPEHRLADVTKVDVDRRLPSGSDLPDDDELHDHSDESGKMLVVVRRALLQGAGLLESPEYQSLRDKGFYICNIVWLSQHSSPLGHQIEFTASLGDPEAGTDFSYAVRGLFRRKPNGELNKTKRLVNDQEQRELLRLLESAAWEALATARQIEF